MAIKKYDESDAVKSYRDKLAAQDSQRPGAYENQYAGQMNALQEQITSRKPFQYDINGDAVFQQYKDRYTQQGKQAMQDTIGQAAALTGGYGSSYGQAVGQQQYNAYLTKLNDVIPELYGQALSTYQAEGDRLNNQYSMLADRENQDYNRYLQGVNQWQTDRDYLANQLANERNFDYSQWSADRSYQQEQEDNAYTRQKNEYSRLETLIAKYGYNPTDDELAAIGMTRAQSDALRAPWVSENTPAATGTGAGVGGGNAYAGELTLDERLQNMIATGQATPDMLRQVIQAAVDDREISPTESMAYAQKYGAMNTGGTKATTRKNSTQNTQAKQTTPKTTTKNSAGGASAAQTRRQIYGW